MIEMTFTYQKNKVIQALRFHFLSRKEIRLLIIAVNLFAFVSALLFFWKKITPIAFLSSSFLWFILMLTIWFLLPFTVYRKNKTFKDDFSIRFSDHDIQIITSGGYKSWPYSAFQYFLESPHFFHLYLNERSFFLLPKEACHEVEDHQLRQHLKDKIGTSSGKSS
jgi:hypothetical protein